MIIDYIGLLSLNAGLAVAARQNATAASLFYNVRLHDVKEEFSAEFVGDIAIHHYHPSHGKFSWAKKNVAYWAWETEGGIPHSWIAEAGKYNEIWVPSTFVRDQVRTATGCNPVVIHHFALPVYDLPKEFRDELVILSCFDGKSRIERKNPFAAVRAFVAAFPRDKKDKVRLVMKCHGAPPSFKRRVMDMCGGDSRVEVIDQFIMEGEMRLLYSRADVFLSLHRGEGFGLHLLEAMSYGMVVVSTAFGGGMDFLSECNSVLVPASKVPARDGYYNSGVWAEPDENYAVEVLREIYRYPEAYSAMRITAKSEVSVKWGIHPTACMIRERVDSLLDR